MARLLAPDEFAGRVTELRPEDLLARGIRGLIVDLDNTLCEWQSEVIPGDIRAWLDEVRSAGVNVCLASNTHNRRRLRRVAESLGLDYVTGVMKPRRRCFSKALDHLGIPRESAAVVGDQIFTDVLGGKRSGIHTIMVSPIHRREFAGTKISRVFEGMLLRWFERSGLLRHAGRQDDSPPAANT